MRDETPPWAGDVGRGAGVDGRVVAATTLWLVAFGWYVLLQAEPRAGLTLTTAALLYGLATAVAGVGFGWGEDRIGDSMTRFVDRRGLALGGSAVAATALTWFVVEPPPQAYQGGLWLGVVLLAAGLAVGAALRTT